MKLKKIITLSFFYMFFMSTIFSHSYYMHKHQFYKYETLFEIPPFKKKVLLNAFPRCGSHWFAYSVCTLTRSDFYEGIFKGIIKDIYRKRNYLGLVRYLAYIDGYDYSKIPQKLIVLIRDPKECMPRQFAFKYDDILDNIDPEYFGGDCFYIENLKVFDAWNPEKRLLIYYEDFITKPRETLKTVLDFMEQKDQLLDTFMKNFEEHKKISIKFYEGRQATKSMSKGKDLKFHQKRSPKGFNDELMSTLKSLYPKIFDKYLKRYE
jgi:hypothetical protein